MKNSHKMIKPKTKLQKKKIQIFNTNLGQHQHIIGPKNHKDTKVQNKSLISEPKSKSRFSFPCIVKGAKGRLDFLPLNLQSLSPLVAQLPSTRRSSRDAKKTDASQVVDHHCYWYFIFSLSHTFPHIF